MEAKFKLHAEQDFCLKVLIYNIYIIFNNLFRCRGFGKLYYIINLMNRKPAATSHWKSRSYSVSKASSNLKTQKFDTRPLLINKPSKQGHWEKWLWK